MKARVIRERRRKKYIPLRLHNTMRYKSSAPEVNDYRAPSLLEKKRRRKLI